MLDDTGVEVEVVLGSKRGLDKDGVVRLILIRSQHGRAKLSITIASLKIRMLHIYLKLTSCSIQWYLFKGILIFYAEVKAR